MKRFTYAYTQSIARWRRATLGVTAATLILGGNLVPPAAIAKPAVQRQQGWNAALKVARLTTSQKLVVQLNILEKPVTRYANAIYQIYARQNGRWVSVYTNQGARLIQNQAGRVVLAPEVISIKELEKQLGRRLEANQELRTVVTLRYDLTGRQEQRISFESIERYQAIAQTTTTQLVAVQSSSFNDFDDDDDKVRVRRGESRFSLSILQRNVTLQNVIARVSLKPQGRQGFGKERLIGDFRYKLKDKKHKAKFIKGLYTGDRVVVRLFTPQNQFIGYSEFEILSSKTAVALVLPDRPEYYGTVRTIYGVDRNEDLVIDRNTQVFDYFTQVSQVQDYRNAKVTFLRSVQAMNLNSFALAGLPAPRSTCVYPTSFQSGSYSLVSRSLQVFGADLAPHLIALPGQQVRIIDINTTQVTVYEVNQLLTSYQTVNNRPRWSGRDDDDGNGRRNNRRRGTCKWDDDDDDKGRCRNQRQGGRDDDDDDDDDD